MKYIKTFEEVSLIPGILMAVGGVKILSTLYHIIQSYKLTKNDEHTHFLEEISDILESKDVVKVKVDENESKITLSILHSTSYIIEIDKIQKSFRANRMGSITKTFLFGENLSDKDYNKLIEIVNKYKTREDKFSNDENKFMSSKID